MSKTFNSAREVFRNYFPKNFEIEKNKKELEPYETREQIIPNNEIIKKLLKEFKLNLEK